jgi:hypothetical protein
MLILLTAVAAIAFVRFYPQLVAYFASLTAR